MKLVSQACSNAEVLKWNQEIFFKKVLLWHDQTTAVACLPYDCTVSSDAVIGRHNAPDGVVT